MISMDTLFKHIPYEGEQELIHDFFMKTVDHKAMSFKARIKPENSVWMEVEMRDLETLSNTTHKYFCQDAKLKNLIICQPENRNRFNKIFGGFIMRQAFELAWANTYTFRCQTSNYQADIFYFLLSSAKGGLFAFTWMIFGSELL